MKWSLKSYTVSSILQYYTFAVATRFMYLIPSSTPTLMWIVDKVGFSSPVHRVARSDLIFVHSFELPTHAEAEIIVPYEHSKELIQTISQVVINNSFPVNYLTEVSKHADTLLLLFQISPCIIVLNESVIM